MYHLRRDTLAFQKMRPYLQKVDAKATPLSHVVEGMVEYEKSVSSVSPEGEACSFYLMNHAVGKILQSHDLHEPLPQELVQILETYHRRGASISRRLFYYILLATTREARHAHKSSAIFNSIPGPIAQFVKALPSDSLQAANALRKFTHTKVGVVEYCLSLREIFNKAGFGHNYGGKPWGNIADSAYKFMTGEYSPETFTDVSWALAHNTGPMFNKGMLYDGHTPYLAKILDVQRGGMIPQFVGEAFRGGSKFTGWSEVFPLITLVTPVLESEMSGYVDWFQVENLGAKGNYKGEQKVQVSKYGHPIKTAMKQASVPSIPDNKFFVSATEYVIPVKRKKVA